ncbi:MAG: competence/damage-inducible protein A [Bacillota bacterium]|nr:competence/damage-inducible protein A [Bacillota bacterium]
MKAALLSVGTELLLGEITNTNVVYLSRELNTLGIDVMYHYTVGDNPQRLAEMLEMAFLDCDLIITTGGLGPTQDDMTKEIVCQVMGDELELKEDILTDIKKRMLAYKTHMTDNNIKQAEMPKRAVIFYNDAGTAPGFALARTAPDGSDRRQYVACMPGPPREMKRMFEKSVRPWLEKMSDGVLVYKELRIFGIGESDLETRLLPLINGQTDPTLATYAKDGECSVRVASKRETAEDAAKAVEEMIRKVDEIVGDSVYSHDNEELVQVVAAKLLERGMTISCAESCTGGMFAAALTDIPGISECFDRGLVTYSNKAKIEELGVRPETLETFGAVSQETALEMASGVRSVSGTDIGISVTGVAGPGGGTEEKPVGLAYIGLDINGRTSCRKIDRRINDRRRNRQYSLLSMLDMINRNL